MTSLPAVVRRLVLVAAIGSLSTGCGALVAGGAGAGAAVYMTSRGAESQVNVSLEQATDATLAVLRARNITVESIDADDDEREIDARLGDLDVDVELDRASAGVTVIEVKAHRAPLGRDNDYAADLLSEIVRAANRGAVSAVDGRESPTLAATGR